MNKQKQFIDFVEYLIENCKEEVVMPEDAKIFYEELKTQTQEAKPVLTTQGAQILQFLQDNQGTEKFKAKEIAEGLGASSRKISGSMRKLVTDGFVDKFGKEPVIYSLTELGKSFDISSLKETN